MSQAVTIVNRVTNYFYRRGVRHHRAGPWLREPYGGAIYHNLKTATGCVMARRMNIASATEAINVLGGTNEVAAMFGISYRVVQQLAHPRPTAGYLCGDGAGADGQGLHVQSATVRPEGRPQPLPRRRLAAAPSPTP